MAVDCPVAGRMELGVFTTCGHHPEGIVAKPQVSPYRELKGKTTWIKIKNPEYSQAEGRRDLFNAPRRVDKRATPQKRQER